MTTTELLRESIKKNEFIYFLRGVNGYQSNDRFNPSPIPYKDNLISLYEVMQDDDKFISLFINTLKLIGTDCEGIYIVTNYLYVLIYHIHKGICSFKINYKEIIEFLSNSIADNKDILLNTTKLSRLGINGCIYEKLQELDNNCYADNNEHLFIETYMTEDTKNKIKMVTKNDNRFYLAEHVVIPNSIGCFKHSNMWFFYSVDEKAYENICGPFTIDGLIYALALEYDTIELVGSLSFSEAEWDIYYNNHFYSMEDIFKKYPNTITK